MRRRVKNIVIERLRIESMAAEGKCVARHDDMVVFVSKVAPGDLVDVRVTKKKKNYLEAIPVKFHEYSKLRKDPFCDHFGICGGCKWQHLDYETQLKYKQQQVEDNFKHLGKLDIPEVQHIIPSLETDYYRNKLEFTFANKRWLMKEEIESGEKVEHRGLGFHIPGHFNKVIGVDHCHLQPDPSNGIRLAVDEFCKENDLSYYDFKTNKGWLKTLIIRTASTGQIMVIVQVGSEDHKNIKGILEHLKAKFPQITSLNYIINQKGNDSYYDQDVVLYEGADYIEEEMEGIKFKIGPKSFYQTNSEQAYELYKVTRDFAALKPNDNVYDLYTGTGTIANFIAKTAKQVIGIEYIPEAIADAKLNSKNNNIQNTSFYAGDMKDMLNEELFVRHGSPDVIITDPPRAGMDTKVIDTLLKVEARTIVYVSCNPATQARDLALLDAKYKITKIQPVDMFPHTHHVENVVQLVLKEALTEDKN